MTMHPTSALQLAHERRRDLERAAARGPGRPPRRPRRLRRSLRRAVPAPLTRTT